MQGKPADSQRATTSLFRHPALSMPCGKSAKGLPIGLQQAGRWYDDDYLLAIARLVEHALG
ncbi:amidase family protein [Variovorax paradoxus]|nr:amidase family protein [Variovorax paradoxus]